MSTLTQSAMADMDDMGRFGCPLSDADLDDFIESKKRTFDAEIWRNGRAIAVERGIRAMCSMDVVALMQDQYGLDYAFKVVTK